MNMISNALFYYNVLMSICSMYKHGQLGAEGYLCFAFPRNIPFHLNARKFKCKPKHWVGMSGALVIFLRGDNHSISHVKLHVYTVTCNQ